MEQEFKPVNLDCLKISFVEIKSWVVVLLIFLKKKT